MARKPSLSIETLSALGIEKLAQMVLDESGRNAAFRKLVNAALAGTKGPDAIAKLIDRRLGALERASSFIDWEKTRAFRDDLRATVLTISGELGSASPAMAIDRLLRFIATEDSVMERVDDSSGRIDSVYRDAIGALGELAPKLKPDEADLLPERIMTALGEIVDGYLIDVANAVMKHLSEPALLRWDRTLAELQRKAEETDKNRKERYYLSNAPHYRSMRQAIADDRGDIDGLIRLEAEKHPNLQDTIGMAERLLEAGRAKEALAWVRNGRASPRRYPGDEGPADGPQDAPDIERVRLEAAILTRLGEREAAQALRWATFEASLNAGILREYIAALSDFEEFDALDRAFAHALLAGRQYNALTLFLDWARLDLAAKLVTEYQGSWDGRHYHVLSPAAEMLEEKHPLAATLIYRALIDDILARGNSQAYGHAARYLKKLDLLAPTADADPHRSATISSHAYYRTSIQKAHGRKVGFWSLVRPG